MKIINIIAIFIMAGHCVVANATEKEKADSIEIVNTIVGVFKNKGMLACQPNIKGADFVFEYIHLFEQVSQLDSQYVSMLKKRYPKENGLDIDAIQASLNLSLEITFTPDQFVSRITRATKNNDGYDVILDNGPVLQLRKTGRNWVAIFPPEVGNQFKQLEPYYTAGQLKRSILIYRMLEAEMANLDKDKVESNVSGDIAPIIVAIFGKEKFPKLIKWAVKDVNEIIKFYGQFSTKDDMKAHIKKSHDLS